MQIWQPRDFRRIYGNFCCMNECMKKYLICVYYISPTETKYVCQQHWIIERHYISLIHSCLSLSKTVTVKRSLRKENLSQNLVIDKKEIGCLWDGDQNNLFISFEQFPFLTEVAFEGLILKKKALMRMVFSCQIMSILLVPLPLYFTETAKEVFFVLF